MESVELALYFASTHDDLITIANAMNIVINTVFIVPAIVLPAIRLNDTNNMVASKWCTICSVFNNIELAEQRL